VCVCECVCMYVCYICMTVQSAWLLVNFFGFFGPKSCIEFMVMYTYVCVCEYMCACMLVYDYMCACLYVCMCVTYA
jgi:hypothetical protein